MGSVPGQGTKILHVCSAAKKKEKKNTFKTNDSNIFLELITCCLHYLKKKISRDISLFIFSSVSMSEALSHWCIFYLFGVFQGQVVLLPVVKKRNSFRVYYAA